MSEPKPSAESMEQAQTMPCACRPCIALAIDAAVKAAVNDRDIAWSNALWPTNPLTPEQGAAWHHLQVSRVVALVREVEIPRAVRDREREIAGEIESARMQGQVIALTGVRRALVAKARVIGFTYTLQVLDDLIAKLHADIASSAAPPEPAAVVGGNMMERSLADFVRACAILIEAEVGAACPNNALVSVLCDAVRLTREMERGVLVRTTPVCTCGTALVGNCDCEQRATPEGRR